MTSDSLCVCPLTKYRRQAGTVAIKLSVPESRRKKKGKKGGRRRERGRKGGGRKNVRHTYTWLKVYAGSVG